MTKAPPTVRDESAVWAGGREMDGGMGEGGGRKCGERDCEVSPAAVP